MTDFEEKYHLEWVLFLGDCDDKVRNDFHLEVTEYIDNLVHERGLLPEGIAGCVGFGHPVGRKGCCDADESDL